MRALCALLGSSSISYRLLTLDAQFSHALPPFNPQREKWMPIKITPWRSSLLSFPRQLRRRQRRRRSWHRTQTQIFIKSLQNPGSPLKPKRRSKFAPSLQILYKVSQDIREFDIVTMFRFRSNELELQQTSLLQ